MLRGAAVIDGKQCPHDCFMEINGTRLASLIPIFVVFSVFFLINTGCVLLASLGAAVCVYRSAR